MQTFLVNGLFPVTWDRLTALALVSAGHSRDDRGGFGFGGLFNMSGTPPGAITGSQAAFASGLLYYRLGNLPRGVGRSWYGGVSLEGGNAWRRSESFGSGGVKKAASVFLGFDSVIGPLYLGYGLTEGGEQSVFLVFGRPF